MDCTSKQESQTVCEQKVKKEPEDYVVCNNDVWLSINDETELCDRQQNIKEDLNFETGEEVDPIAANKDDLKVVHTNNMVIIKEECSQVESFNKELELYEYMDNDYKYINNEETKSSIDIKEHCIQYVMDNCSPTQKRFLQSDTATTNCNRSIETLVTNGENQKASQSNWSKKTFNMEFRANIIYGCEEQETFCVDKDSYIKRKYRNIFYLCKRDNENIVYMCEECNDRFLVFSEFKRHCDDVHKNPDQLVCKECHKQFLKKETLKMHINAVHQKLKNYPCDLCHKKFSWPGTLWDHMKTVHKRNVNSKCKEDEKLCVNNDCKIHIKNVHMSNKNAKCEKDERTKSGYKMLNENLHEQNKNLKCKKNEETCVNSDSEIHIKRRYKNVIYLCEIKNENVVYLCKKCNNIFLEFSTFTTHCDEVHKKNTEKPECEECGRKFHKLVTLKRHINVVHHGIRTYMCDICNRKFLWVWTLRVHMKNKHMGIKDFKSEQYEKTACVKDDPDVLVKRQYKHLYLLCKREDEQNIVYLCKICNNKFLEFSIFRQHYDESHKFVCVKCDKSFLKLCSLKAHDIHCKITRNDILCEKCNKTFVSPVRLREHTYVVHKKVKNHECDKCQKKFACSKYLIAHMNIVHNTVKRFECAECGKTFYYSGQLKNHSLTHTKTNHQCKECDKSFHRIQSLKEHININHKGNVRQCEECNKSFRRADGLREHMNAIHRGIVRKCKECDKIFNRADGLREHISTVHRGNLVICEECGRIFCRLRNLKRHIKDVHKNFTSS